MIKRLFSTTKKFPIIVTNNAWNKMTEIVNKKTRYSGFLFSVTSGGCNGFNYDFNLLNGDKYHELMNNKRKPTIIEKNNIKIFIDPIAEMYLFGTTIDHISEDYEKGLFENKFVFFPDKNLASSCGCGISFTPKI
jgi:iron-sulfur cluster assembly accessory protein